MSSSNLLDCTTGVLIILLVNLVQSQANYTRPQEHFINCGSRNDTKEYRRTFIADVNQDGEATAATSTGTTSPIYQTARVFRRQSSYELNLDENGTYIIRLHFYPFSSPLYNLLDAKFNVSASRYALLSNFSIQNSSNSPVIKEFIFYIDPGSFKIIFTPQKSSFAFVNAIETFVAPNDLIPSTDPPHVTVTGSSKDGYKDLLTRVLFPVFRINVGGDLVNPEDDNLWRKWLPDDKFLYDKKAAKNSPMYNSKLYYPPGGATDNTAPDSVYTTAKEMNINREEPSNFNVTWKFNVTRYMKQYFIRAHFCDIIHDQQNSKEFKFYINNRFSYKINLKEKSNGNSYLATPYYYDFVVDSGVFGLLNISIGPSPGTKDQTAPFLNGLEIMEVMSDKSIDGLGGSKTKKKTLVVIIATVVGGVVFVFFLLVLFAIGRRKKAKAVENMDWPLVNINGGSSFSGPTESIAPINISELNLELKVAFSEILYATNNCDPNLIIGRGGFGKVYKGTLRGGLKVAVKRSECGHGQGFPEFQTEIMVLSSIRHRHLVSLMGYCDEMSEMILVYEFMEKGTLREHLYKEPDFKSPTMPHLSYNQRLDICIGAAKGLHYLHTAGSIGGIIHRDVKSTNILLDKDFVAKVSDFGLSRSGLPDETHISTDVKGTFGYLDPEYFRCMQLTQKSDVYSFGVVLLEVLCARPVINKMLPRDQVNLGDWGLFWQQKDQLEMIIDPSLVGKINLNSLRKFGETAAKCLKEYGADRPSMVDVIWDLEYALQLQLVPEDRSNTEFSWAMMPLPLVQRLPSTSTTIEDEEMHLRVDDILDSSYGDATDVFS